MCVVAIAVLVAACGGGGSGDGGGADSAGAVVPFDPQRALPPASAEALAEVSGTTLQIPDGLTEHDLMDSMKTPWVGFPDAATQRTYEEQVRAARGAIKRYADADAARRDGYVLASYFIPEFGSHWINWSRVTAPFDPAEPGMLLYDGDGTRARLVGLSYYVRSPGNVPPEGFAGQNDQWHRHFGTCYLGGFLVAETAAYDGCLQRCEARATGAIEAPVGTKAEIPEMDRYLKTHPVPAQPPPSCTFVPADDLWMLHLWLVPGHANPQGLFSTQNPKVATCAGTCRPEP